MKNLIIRSGSLRMGGIERVLMEILNNISKEKYNIYLIIEDDSGKNNIFLNQVPKDIPIYFLKSQELIGKTDYHRKRKDSLYHKLMYNINMMREHKVVLKNTKEIIDNIKTKIGKIDVFLDYDWGARRYVDKLDVEKKIVWVHSSIPKLLKKESKIKRFGKNLNKYDAVVTICDEMKKETENIYPYLKNKVKRVYNPFNFKRILDLARDNSKLTEEEQELISQDYIVAVSRLDLVSKDYKTLILGYKEAYKKGIKEKLYIVGDGTDRDKIQDIINTVGLENQIKLLGLKINPYIWMKNSHLFVHSSKFEGLAVVLIEAMICGKVAISSKCPVGPSEVLKYGKVGMLFEVGDYKKLGEELYLLLTDDDKRKQYEEKLKDRIVEFRSDIVITEYEKIIDEI
ncbi:MAG: glycosyltransferase [Fusobacterium sp. JB019]|nr:glycosyltransferase [Fusobacterium sp. JB019]